jgi:hypothetical protein
MFGELPKIFDRDFVVAFFFPATLFVLASVGLLTDYNIFPDLLPLLREDALKGATIIGVLAWAAGVLLLVLNYGIYRLLEGYGNYNPLKLLRRFQLQRHELLQKQIAQLTDDVEERKFVGDEVGKSEIIQRRIKVRQQSADWYPREAAYVLPTAFGNAMRAFENYSVDMYGADAIVLWVRLLAVLPADFRQMMNAAKAQTDFWVNLWLIGYLLLVENLLLIVRYERFGAWWVAALAAILIIVAPRHAKLAAVAWGDYVKASFDLYLPELREKLKHPVPTTAEEEKRQWNEISRQVLYHMEPKEPARFKKAIKMAEGTDQVVTGSKE